MSPIPGDPADALRTDAVDPVAKARLIATLTRNGDPHRTAGDREPGSGGAPGGAPVTPPDPAVLANDASSVARQDGTRETPAGSP